MARIHADLTIDFDPCTVPAYGLTVHGHIHVPSSRLRALFGEPTRSLSGHAEAGMWVLDTPAGRVPLAPRRLRTPLGCATGVSCWLILAASDDVLPWIFKAVTGSTATFVNAARRHFSESTLETFTAAYVSYLFLRADAEQDWCLQQDWNDPRYKTWRRRPEQLHHAAREVLAVLHHYQWSQATETQRQAWTTMGRPVQGGSQSDLDHWLENSRWLYSPTKTTQYPHGGDPDLAGMLRGLADTSREHQPMLREINPHLDFDLRDEHEQTLQALAGTPIPGPDALATFSR
ncbi:hypothetical protein [Amycolatopsis saalfeldensis]|uniref:Uncharacterized protein n=1 Tax=Amycolatopsis saalfeldensis TaxID=394193 RepID=A0A1H8YND4_9PSEU|nr:hypothetical protein [Amycolatopsis saalfeldensis]SEP53687.1 hypothetical protein SAMN04489732_129133 [Amycolatopsis saalfeldensis]